MSLVVLAIFFTIGTNFVRVSFQNGFGNALPQVWAFVSGYPFSFVLMGAFATLNGLFVFLMRAPTALGRPIMDQLSGFRLYLEKPPKPIASICRRPRSPPSVSRRSCPTRSPSTSKSRGRKPSRGGLRRAHPGEADPMSHYQPG